MAQYVANSIIRTREGRHLEVKETQTEIKALIDAGKTHIEVTEVRQDLQWKSPTPIDTKAEFKTVEVKHVFLVSNIIDVQPAGVPVNKMF